jgi:hypothetical protein
MIKVKMLLRAGAGKIYNFTKVSSLAELLLLKPIKIS